MISKGTVGARMVSVSGVITRADGTVEDLGIMAYYHMNPLKRFAWRLGRAKRWILERARALKESK